MLHDVELSGLPQNILKTSVKQIHLQLHNAVNIKLYLLHDAELSGCNAHPELLQFGEVGHIPDPLYAIVCKVKSHQVHLENDISQLF